MTNVIPTYVGGAAHQTGTPDPIDIEPSPKAQPPLVKIAPTTPPNGFNPMIDLKLDGREVRFSSEAGPYEAPAIVASLVTDQTAGVVNKQWGARPDGTFGYWPDDAYVPTGWQEI